MFKITLTVATLVLSSSMIKAGFLRNQLAYSAVLPSPLPFAAEHHYNTPYGGSYGAPYAAPLPVASLNDNHPYAVVGYCAPPVVKFRSSSGSFDCNPFTTYASVRSHNKFAFPAPAPSSVYNAPPPVTFGSPAVSYSGFEAPNIVVKFGSPITTTTTTYSTAAAAAAVPVGNPLNGLRGW